MGDNSDPVTTVKDARAVIEELARRKGTFTHEFGQEAQEEAKNGRKGMLQAMEGSEEIRKDLAMALGIISADLYTNRARFLMEVIQNADDNSYNQDETPTVSITIRPKHVKIECNEVGFSRENIQALCRTGRSSKAPGQGFTGEKGIGFKSVFKIAQRAHVRSPPYYFQLDKMRELGMITPQWDEDFFDDHEKGHQTTIVLDRICDPSTDFSTALEKDIMAIEPVLILFLRRLQRLHLTIFKSSSDGQPAISKRFRRLDWTPESGFVSLQDENTNFVYSFYKHRFTTGFGGTEIRRPNITNTDIVLAFPVLKLAGTYMPWLESGNLAFAYLPLGDFGFKFVIQADFLLTSNRESVDEDNHWNRTIAAAIPRAFEAVVNTFNITNAWNPNLEKLANMWPLYLENNSSGLSPYWSSITNGINHHLSTANVIKNRTGSFSMPTLLMFLDWAHDRHGEPVLGHKSDFISPKYPDSVRNALLSLGVTAPNWKWVCEKLEMLHDGSLLHTKMRNLEWSSDLAKVILKSRERRNNRECAKDLKNIPLIPLTNGTWRCPPSENDPFYFPANFGVTIPPGLPLSLVTEEACACPDRRELFRIIGVKDCNIPNVVKRILDYHVNLTSAVPDHLIDQVKYLYKMREHLHPDDMGKIHFQCSAGQYFQKGYSTYADISDDGKLRRLFSGYHEALFLNGRYFADLNHSQRAEFAKWLGETARVALVPRFTDVFSGLHSDFKWLLKHRSDEILGIMKQNWGLYSKTMTMQVKTILADCKVRCKSGSRAPLSKTYIPLPALVEKTRTFGNVDHCDFVDLPSHEPKDWKFLSSLGVGVDEGLDFYLWVLNQRGFLEHGDVENSKLLYLEIQSRAFSPTEVDKAQKACSNALVKLPNHWLVPLTGCVWDGPRGFSSKTALRPVYGHHLNRLFQEILKVPNVTSAEALIHLERLRYDKSTTMADVTEVYEFLQTHCANSFRVDSKTACIAVPSVFDTLVWKTPEQCVWDDDEFSQNGIELACKSSIRLIMEKHAPTTKIFFTEILKLPNAGIGELLGDLTLMSNQDRSNPERVYRIYERIQSCRRRCSKIIMNAFKKAPLVFFRGPNYKNGKWLSLEECIWTRSILRDKYALMPSLNEYRDLFRDTLEVSNPTIDMLLTDLLKSSTHASPGDEDDYMYAKDLVQEIARFPQNNEKLELLNGRECWPCRTPVSPRQFCSIGSFYVNDRQDLFDIFSGTHTFLDFDFDTSRKLAGLLRHQSCDSFLSEKVLIHMDHHGSLKKDNSLTQDFRDRADALLKYFDHAGCQSPYKLKPLLENVKVWSADIMVHYTLDGTTVTMSEGGSSVKVSTGEDKTAQLTIYTSTDRHKRDCALVTDFPEQLIAALELKPANLPTLHSLLQVPFASLDALLIRKGITSGDAADNSRETSVTDWVDTDLQSQSDGSSTENEDGASTSSAGSARSDSAGLAVAESTRASARSMAANTTLRPHVDHRSRTRPTTPEPQLQENLDVPSDETPRERPVTPRPAAAGLYSADERNRNMERIQGFARNAYSATSSRPRGSSVQSGGGGGGAFDMSRLGEALLGAESAYVSTPVRVSPSPRRRAGPIPNRNAEEMDRDFEVGFLGEYFVYELLHHKLRLPNFTGEVNWTSSLRNRAGFSNGADLESDFTYKDRQGALTRHFLQMQHPYATPDWLSTACDNGNIPLYRIEVKSTTSQDHATTFYMSGRQYQLAKKLRVTSATPSEVYVILRVSSLDAVEIEAGHEPQWGMYLDPYTLGQEGLLEFTAPTYAVRATA